jgi:RNA-directed DNA polymerase
MLSIKTKFTRLKIAKNWDDIDWACASEKLAALQYDVLKAHREGNHNKVLMAQHKLVRSFAARCLAVRKATSNRGKKTPGIDGKTYDTKLEKFEAVQAVKSLKDYKCEPARRVYITRSDGRKRPLGIPTIKDRVVQTLYLFAVDPIAEELADSRSYGFRMYRGVHDCATYLNLVLSSYTSTRRYVLDADIEQFFPSVSHKWLLDNIPMDKRILAEFLNAGFYEDCLSNPAEEDFPQGSPISPLFANMSLNGLQEWLGKEFLFVRYADDFVVLGKSEQALNETALLKIREFLEPRGLSLNSKKTSIAEINEGFDYLSFNFREYRDPSRVKGTKQGIFLIKPSAKNVYRFKQELSKIVKEHRKRPINVLIQVLNRKLRGWAEHYRTVTSQKTFSSISYHLWKICWTMLSKRHRKRSAKWIRNKYFTKIDGNKWIFCSKSKANQNEITDITLFQIAYVEIKRHSLCLDRNPYDPTDYDYFRSRIANKSRHSILLGKVRSQLLKKQKGVCPVCHGNLLNWEELEVHHVLPRKQGGTDKLKNLRLLHKTCHKQITNCKNEHLRATWRENNIIT